MKQLEIIYSDPEIELATFKTPSVPLLYRVRDKNTNEEVWMTTTEALKLADTIVRLDIEQTT